MNLVNLNEDFPGQSRILNLLLGVPGKGYNVPDFRGFKLKKGITKISLQNPKNRHFRGQIFVRLRYFNFSIISSLDLSKGLGLFF